MADPNDAEQRSMRVDSIRFSEDGHIEAIDFGEGFAPTLPEVLDIVLTYHEQLIARKRQARTGA